MLTCISSSTHLLTTTSSIPKPSVTSSIIPTTSIPPDPNARALSGTGMTCLYPENNSDAVWLLYQDVTGNVRQIPYTNLGNWDRSQSLPIKNVFNSSSLVAISYKTPANSSTIIVRINALSLFVLSKFEANQYLSIIYSILRRLDY